MKNVEVQWAPKVSRNKIRRLYEKDAIGIVDDELIDDVGWSLWHRCNSILIVTEAHSGRVQCPSCKKIIKRNKPWSEDENIECSDCGWQILWAKYHQSYKSKQLFGANAVGIFEKFYIDFPMARTEQEKMLMIDQLIHAFHISIKEIGRPVAVNLIKGKLGEVIHFLDNLSSSEETRSKWRHTLASTNWAHHFIDNKAEMKDKN